MKLQNLTETCSWDKGKILEEHAQKAEKKTRGGENEYEWLVLKYPGLDLDDPSRSPPTQNILRFFIPLLVRSWSI